MTMMVQLDVGYVTQVQTTPTVRRRSRLTFGSGRHLTQVKKGGANEPPPYDYSTVHLVGIITNDETGRLVPNPQATRQEPMPLARFKAVARGYVRVLVAAASPFVSST